ncbi:uncharacterized protein [Rutidosis leptorrhynchoides]|uniref:uncharacterized protein n=1 Tax=Rutidosis leptorrhynchoides TaxID=125765 RepID=UPI003A991EC2
MDRIDRTKWMYDIGRTSPDYLKRLEEFITIAETDQLNKGSTVITCPCKKYMNGKSFKDSTYIKNHLIINGFMRGYTCWSYHGESLTDHNPGSLDSNQLNEEDSYISDNDNFEAMFEDIEDNVDEKYHEKFEQLKVDSQKPLYNGCTKFSKLSAVIKLLNIKASNGWSDTSFTSLLELLHKMLPEDNELPVSTYYGKKLMCPMGLEIQRIHACPNDCMLYRNENENLHECKVCGTSRYKCGKPTDEDTDENGPPAKHAVERKKDGKIRHVADSVQRRTIDNEFEDFRNEIRNITFGLNSDGMNPFGDLGSGHSTWPVLLCIYNLPSWLCMKQKHIMISLLIQGPKQSRNNIDVYLAPLIDDLKLLWDTGVQVYDSYKKEYFQLRAILFCTINDFQAYGNFSGYTTKGKKACPVCEKNTYSIWLKNCRKPAFMGHRRELAVNHPYRFKNDLFDGTVEKSVLPPRSNGKTIFKMVRNLKVVLGKTGNGPPKGMWKKNPHFGNYRIRSICASDIV